MFVLSKNCVLMISVGEVHSKVPTKDKVKLLVSFLLGEQGSKKSINTLLRGIQNHHNIHKPALAVRKQKMKNMN